MSKTLLTPAQISALEGYLAPQEVRELRNLYALSQGELHIPYAKISPTPVQMRFLRSNASEALFGGAVGGGKSIALMLAAFMYADVPNYKALLVRKTTRDLEAPGGLVSVARDWLYKSGAKWNHDNKRFYLKNNITIDFGHFENDIDADRYQGLEFNYIGLDEAGQHTQFRYDALLQRIRRQKTDVVPSRMRCTANPGGVGHQFLFQKFVDPRTATGEYYPANLADNPHIDSSDYMTRLTRLSKLAQDQLIRGMWVLDMEGLVYQYKRDVNACESPPDDDYKVIIGIDLGSSERQKTTGFAVVLWSKYRKEAYIVEAWAESGLTPASIAETCIQTMERWGDEAVIVMDEGALGRGYANEMRARYQLPVIAAQKRDKNGFIKLMNGDFEQSRLFVCSGRCEDLVKEYESLMWDDSGKQFRRDQSDHVSDAALYAWRHSHNWLAQEVRSKAPVLVNGVDVEAEERAIFKRSVERQAKQWWEV